MKTITLSNKISSTNSVLRSNCFKPYTAFLILLLLFKGLLAQQSPTYAEMLSNCDQYYNSLISEYGEAAVIENESNGYVQFLKWKQYVLSNFNSGTSPIDYYVALKNYYDGQLPFLTGIGDWDELGPNKQPGYVGNNQNIAGGLRGVGPLNFIAMANDFEDSEMMLAGGWNSGLFVTNNGGDDWQMAGTDQIAPHISAACCEISHFDNDTWFMATGNGDGFFNNDQFFSEARCTGLYRTTNAGETWELIGEDQDLGGGTVGNLNWIWQIANIRMDPSSPSTSPHLYVAGSGGIYRTTNALASEVVWEKVLGTDDIVQNTSYPDLTNVNSGSYVLWAYDIEFLPDPDWPCSDCSRLVATLTKRVTGPYVNDLAYSLNEYESVIYMSEPSGILQTGDIGTWSQISLPGAMLTNTSRINVETTPANPNKLYVMIVQRDEIDINLDPDIIEYAAYSPTTFFTYDLNNQTWSNSLGSPEEWDDAMHRACGAFAVAQDNFEKIFMVDGGGPGMAQWNSGTLDFDAIENSLKYHDDVEDIVITPDGTKMFLATHGGVYEYTFNTNVWQEKNTGLGCGDVDDFDASHSDPNILIAGFTHDGSMRTSGIIDQNAWNWIQVHGGDGQTCSVNSQDNMNMYVSMQIYNYGTTVFERSTDGYADDANNVSLVIPNGSDYRADIELNPFDNQQVYVPGFDIFRHETGGNNELEYWEQISNFDEQFFIENGTWNAYRLWTSKANKDILFCNALSPDEGRIFLCNRSSQYLEAVGAWTRIPKPAGVNYYFVNDIEPDPNNPNVFYICTGYFDLNNPQPYRIIKYTYTGGSGNIMEENPDQYGFLMEDFTNDLPNVVVYEMSIIPGSGEIFLGTDCGVFYTDKEHLAPGSSQVWWQYGTQLPHAKSRKLIANLRSNQMRVGTYGRGVWQNDLPCSKLEDPIVIESGQTVTWNYDQRFRCDVVIKNGGSLILTDEGNEVRPTFYFAEHCGIIVETGGRLEAEKVTITNACPESFWLGIMVWGNPNANQLYPYSNQGYAKLTDCIIQNAHTGVWLTKVDLGGGQCTTDPNYGGGVVHGLNTQFLNNYVDAEFFPYNWELEGGDFAPNKSHFYNCDFRTTGLLAQEAIYPKAHIILDDISQLDIKGCRFRNDALDNIALSAYYNQRERRGDGIRSTMSSFKVKDYCTLNNDFDPECEGDIIGSSFDNLNVAIFASDGTASRTFEVSNAKFGEDGFNYLGIGALAFDIGPAIINNDMRLGPLAEDSEQDLFGIYLITCSGQEIEENTIYSLGTDNDTQHNLIGILSLMCFQNSNRIYRNSFNKLDFAVHAQENNGFEDAGDQYGLVYECNAFATTSNNNQKDIVLANFASINPVQASYENGSAAGNTFSHWCPMVDFHTDIELGDNAVGFTYHCTTDPDEVPETGCYPDGVGEVIVEESNASNSCEENTGGGELPDDEVLVGMALLEKELVTEAREIYHGTMDQGNTAGLVTFINNAGHSSMEIRNEMLACSPNVSDPAFRAAFLRIPAMDPWHLAQVLLMNSPLKPAVQQMMIQYNYDEYYRELVMNGQNGGMTYKSILETDMARHHVLYEVSKNDYFRRKLLDDEVIESQAIIDFLNTEPKLNEKYVTAGMFNRQGEFTAALNALGTCTSGGTVDPICRTMEVYIGACADGRQCPRFNSAQRTELELLAANTSTPGWQYAYALLGYDFPFYFQPPTHFRSSSVNYSIPELHTIKVQPNPTNGFTYFTYQLPEGAEKAELEIVDPLGRVILSSDITASKGLFEWNSHEMANGIYLYNFKVDGILLDSGKITVTH